MARVAVAYVEVRPDMSKFAAMLEAELKAIHQNVHVGVDTDKSKLDVIQQAVSDAATKSVAASTKANERIEKAQQTHAAKMQAINDKMTKHDVDELLKEEAATKAVNRSKESAAQASANKLQAINDGMLKHQVDELLKEETATKAINRSKEAAAQVSANKMQAINDKMTKDELDAISKTEKQKLDTKLKNATAASNKLRRLDAAATSARIARERGEASRINTIANNNLKNRLRIINENARRTLLQERANADMTARVAAEEFAKAHVAEWGKRVTKVGVEEARTLERTMISRFGPIGGKVARTTVRDFDREVTKRMNKSGLAAAQRFAQSFGDKLKMDINLRLGRLAPIFGLIAATAAPLASVLSGIGAGLTAVTAYAGQAAAALGVSFVSALIAVGQAAGVAKFGLKGFGDALKALDNIQTKVAAGIEVTEADLRNYNEQLAKLAPAARQVVTALGKVHGQFATIRKTVQGALFAGVADEISTLARSWLPMLQMRMQGTAQVINQVAKSFTAWATQPRVVGQLSDVMAGNNRIVAALGQALVPLLDIVLRLTRAFQPLGLMLANYVSAWALATNQSQAASVASGKLAGFVTRLSDTFDQMVRITRSVGSALKGTFSAALPAGQLLMNMFERLVRKWDLWANSITGQSAIATWAYTAIPALSALGRLIGDLFRMFNALSAGGNAAAFTDQLRAIIPPLQALLLQLSSTGAFASFVGGVAAAINALVQLGVGGVISDTIMALAGLFTWIAKLTQQIPALGLAIKVLIAALAALAAIRLTATITGLARLPGIAVGVITFGKAIWGATVAEKAMELQSYRVGSAIRVMAVNVVTFTRVLFGLEVAEMAAAGAAARWGASMKSTITSLAWIARLIAIQTAGMIRWIAVNVVARAATLAWAAAMWLLDAAMSANPLGLLVVGIAALIAGMVLLYTKVKFFREGLATSMQIVGGVIKWVIGIVVEFGKWLGNLITKIPGVKAIGAAFKWVGDKIGGAFKWLGRELGIVDEAQQANAQSAREAAAAQAHEAEEAAKAAGAMSKATVQLNNMKKAQDAVAVATRNASQVTAESAQLDATHIDALARKHKLTTGAISNAWSALANSYVGQEKQRALATAKANIEILKADLKLATARAAATTESSHAWLNAQKAISGINAEIAKATGQYNSLSSQMDALLVQAAQNGGEVANAYGGAINTATKAAKQKVFRTAAGILTSMTSALSKIDPFTFIKGGARAGGKKLAFDTGREIANYLAKGITSGTANIAKVSKFIQRNFSAKLSQIIGKSKQFWAQQKKISAALPGFAAKMKKFKTGKELDTYLATRQTYYETLLDQIKDFKANAIQALTSRADLVGHFGFIPTPEEVKAELDAQLATIKDFTANVAALQQKGLDPKLIKAWMEAGPEEAGNVVTALAGATQQQIDAVNQSYKDIGTTATTAVRGVSNQFFGVGQSTVEGYIAGIKSMRVEAGKEMAALIDYVVKETKKKLKAKSPSQVYAGIGTDTVAGYIEGVTGMQGATVAAVNKLYDAAADVKSTLAAPTLGRPGYAAPGALGANATVPPQVNVRVYVGDKEITDIVRTEVENADSTRARALLSGRR